MKIMLANFAKMVDDPGGMAKVTCAMANEFVRRGHEVTLVYSDVKEGEFFFPINQKVKCFDLRHFRGESIKFPLHLKIKREIFRLLKKQLKVQSVTFDYLSKFTASNLSIIVDEEKPDIIISSNLGTSNVFFADLKTDIPLITMSHGDPIFYFTDTPEKVRESFIKSAACQVLLPSHVDHIKDKMPDANVIVIGNAVTGIKNVVDLSKHKDTYKIIFIGGLIKNIKRPHLLIEAFSKIANDFPDWIVELWGPEDRQTYMLELRSRIASYGLKDRVLIKGSTKDVDKVLSDADIFVSTSKAEGFGLTVAEALSKGIPAVAYKSCPGVNELIKDGYSGLLCEEGVNDLAAKLKTLMQNREMRIQFGSCGVADMKEYDEQNIWDKWEKLVYDIKNKKC